MKIPLLSKAWGSCVDTESVTGQQIATLKCVGPVLTNIILALLVFGGFVAAVLIIWGGIKYSSSRGDPQAVEGAKKTITWAIIGLVFVILSFAILQIIESLIGVEVLN